MSTRLFRLTLLAGAISLGFAAAATAQDYGGNDSTIAAPDENVIVIGPNFNVDRSNLRGPVERISMRQVVRYDDLDLSTRSSARELRARIRETARDICDSLREAYPVPQQPQTPRCYDQAVRDGLVRADAAIRDARYRADYYEADYRR